MPNVKFGPYKELLWMPEVPANIASLVPYPPGKPIEETKREFHISEVVKMASNENPLGSSPKAIAAAMASLKEAHIYPDGSHYELKRALAAKQGCRFEDLSIGNGSNEFIDLLMRVFVPQGCNVITHKAAFVAYRLCAQLQGCDCIEVPVDENLQVNVDTLLKAVNDKTRMVMLANPNNPTGNFLNAEEIDQLATELHQKRILLVLDYAYWEYVTEKSIPDPMQVFKKHPNVLILRTFSKVYGLAGLRVGYLVGRSRLTAMVEKARQPFNVSSVALAAATAAVEDTDFLKKSIKLNGESKAELVKELSQYPIRIYPSQGNFILVDMRRPSKDIYNEFLKRGVIIRPVSNYGLLTHFRISAGLSIENKKLFQAMSEIFK